MSSVELGCAFHLSSSRLSMQASHPHACFDSHPNIDDDISRFVAEGTLHTRDAAP